MEYTLTMEKLGIDQLHRNFMIFQRVERNLCLSKGGFLSSRGLQTLFAGLGCSLAFLFLVPERMVF